MNGARAAWRLSGAALLAGIAISSCASLPQLEAGECGNRVIDELEDCDGFPAESGAECRAPGTAGQCHFDCARRPDGSRPACPTGWGCDANDICRRPTGEWETLREIEVGTASQLMSGDFDGDGRADLVSLEAMEGAGLTRAKFHYFDANAELSETRSFPLRMLAPTVASVTGDPLSDVLFSDPRVGLLRGRSDRSWLPDAFSSYRIPNTGLRVVGVTPERVERGSGFVVFGSPDGEHGLYIADSNSDMPRLLAPLSGTVELFAGEPATGHIFEDRTAYPCSQVVLGLRGESRFWLYDACTTRPDVPELVWREQAERYEIALMPPAPIDSGPLVADLNGDQHLDVLIGANGMAYVSYGDGQSLAPAVPYVPQIANLAEPLPRVPMPLAVADVTGDGAPDFVLPDAVFLSRPSASGSGFDYRVFIQLEVGYWDLALAADLNGNGKLDFVAASTQRPGIDFFNGTGTSEVTMFSVPTNRPVRHLVTGDFDGDLLLDLALSQASTLSGAPDSVLMAYGAPAGPPRPPVPVALMSGIEQLSSMREGVLDHLMISSSNQSGEARSGALAVLASNGDRVPVASLELTTFAEDSSTESSAALRLTAGGLLAPGNGDVLALAFGRDRNGEVAPGQGLQAWLLPALSRNGTATRLAASFPPSLAPVTPLNLIADALSLATRALDLDGDGRDEVLVAAPSPDGQRCSLAAYAVEPTELVGRGSWALDEPCLRIELDGVDADADGALDVLVRTGPNPDGSGSLSILWNDGGGAFDPERRTLLTSNAPLAHAVLGSSLVRPLTVAVVDAEGLWLIPASQQAREFEAPQPFVSRPDCTGVAAADFNGDAVLDLAYAAGGNINVLEAVLEIR